MRKIAILGLLLVVGLVFAKGAVKHRAPRIDPETGLLEEMQPEKITGKTPMPPDPAYLDFLRGYGPNAELDETQWDPDVRLTNNSVYDYPYAYGRHTVATDPAGRVHVVWYSARTPGNYSPQIYYKRYYPGSGWTNDTCISADISVSGHPLAGYSYYPAICVDSSGDVHVAWYVNKATSPTGYYIAYKKCTPTSSGNGGWDSATTRITEDTLLWTKAYPSIEASPNGNIHVVYYCYYSTLGYAIGYKEKTSSGWQPRVWVDSQSTSGYRWWPKVAADRNNNVHVTWYGYGGTSYYQIGYRGRFNGTWGPVQQNISGGVYYQYYPSIAVNPVTNHVHIVWQGYDAGYYYYRIIHKERLGTGSSDTFQLIGDTVSEPGLNYYQYTPTVTTTLDGRVHVVWYGYSTQSPSYPQIRYNERSAGGVWGTPINLQNITGSYRYYPSINNGGNSSNPNDVHVVWVDSRDGNYEVYYKHGNPPPPYDLAMYRIDIPAGLHEVGENVNPSVWVKNVGTNSVSSFSVKLVIGTAYEDTVDVSATIAPGDTYNVTGFATWIPSARGNYAVRCSVMLSGDGNANNDLLTKTTNVVDFVERFDVTDGNFRGTGGWRWGQPASPRTPPPSLPNCWGDVLSGNYANNANDTLISFRLVAIADTPVVNFYHWMNCETYWDGGNVKYSTDGGNTWTLLYPYGTRSYYGYVYGLGEYGYSGNWNWELATFRIPVDSGTSFMLHWRFGTDASVVYYGWLIDNVAGVGCRKPIDVGAREILAPTGNIPWGVPVTPRAVVWNYGQGTQTFPVKFDIGTVYSDTENVTLSPGQCDTVEFSAWTPGQKGTYALKCSTMLSTDEVPDNDQATGSCFVYLTDVQPTLIVQPVGEVDSGAVVSPQVKVKNNGTSGVSFYVRLRIGSDYNQRRLVVGVTPDEERLVTGFPNWVANQWGTFEVRCTTELDGDMIPSNDLLVDTVRVTLTDVGATEILQPGAVVGVGTPLTPMVRVKNFGPEVLSFDLHFVIEDTAGTALYDQTEAVTLGSREERVHSFATTWTPPAQGNYLARSFTVLVGDARPNNDTVVKRFAAQSARTPGWSMLKDIPAPVKDGAWLAVQGDGDGARIYASPGYKNANFYYYDPFAMDWYGLAPLPLGAEGKLPHKGGAGCYGDGYVYAVKGNNTPGFWRYSVADNTWEQLANIPPGPSGKNPKGGTDVVYVVLNDTGYVYLLKGYKQDFMRYNVVSGAWQILPNAPAGSKPKWDKGSWIVARPMPPDTTGDWYQILAHKAKYHEFWVYSTRDNAWSETQLERLPFTSTRTGRNKKSKDGADGAYYNEFVYALKGGNTVEFWRYDIAANTWTEFDPMPEMGSTGRKKRVKSGGALVSDGTGLFYAFKGGKTQEFWCYFDTTVAVLGSAPERSGVMTERTGIARFGFSLAPNPLSKGFGVLSYSVPQSGEARLTVYDVTGRTVLEYGFVASGTGTRSLDLRSLSAGVYLVRFEAAGASASQKLIVE